MPSKKRPRTEAEETGAECPFTVRQRPPTAQETARFVDKKSRRETVDDGKKTKWQWQTSPFAAAGFSKTPDALDVRYAVEPMAQWSEMTRYNSFVLGKEKFHADDFVFVANEDSVKRQKTSDPGANGATTTTRRANSDWVARILEIRALDEQHVYARVFWMYWPDELPAGTHLGGKTLRGGRQPYHGKHELIASNHMDIINAVSVTMAAQVNHWIETDEEDNQVSLYWRQAFNCSNSHLSPAKKTCKCDTPAHPDKVLIRCSSTECSQWMHDDCLRHDALMRVYARLGTKEPQTSDTLSTEPETKKGAKVEEQNGTGPPPTTPGAETEESNGKAPGEDGKLPLYVGPRPPLAQKPAKDAGKEPYRGLFEATLRLDDGPTAWRIRDLRTTVEEAGVKTWLEQAHCLFCSRLID